METGSNRLGYPNGCQTGRRLHDLQTRLEFMTRLLRSLFSDKPTDPADEATGQESHPEQPAEPGVNASGVRFNTMSPFNDQYASHLPAKGQFPPPDSSPSAGSAGQ
jgi:hypothetical protein